MSDIPKGKKTKSKRTKSTKPPSQAQLDARKMFASKAPKVAKLMKEGYSRKEAWKKVK